MLFTKGDCTERLSCSSSNDMFSNLTLCVSAGNIAAAVLQEVAEMTITPELNDRESTHADLYISAEKQEGQREKESAEVEAEVEGNQGEDEQRDDKEMEEKKDSLPEESLRMTSWVEVENEGSNAQESSEEEMSGKERVEEEKDTLEGRSMEEAEKEQTRSVEEELAMMEEKWREQCAINETLKQRLADEEERFRVRDTHRRCCQLLCTSPKARQLLYL